MTAIVNNRNNTVDPRYNNDEQHRQEHHFDEREIKSDRFVDFIDTLFCSLLEGKLIFHWFMTARTQFVVFYAIITEISGCLVQNAQIYVGRDLESFELRLTY